MAGEENLFAFDPPFLQGLDDHLGLLQVEKSGHVALGHSHGYLNLIELEDLGHKIAHVDEIPQFGLDLVESAANGRCDLSAAQGKLGLAEPGGYILKLGFYLIQLGRGDDLLLGQGGNAVVIQLCQLVAGLDPGQSCPVVAVVELDKDLSLLDRFSLLDEDLDYLAAHLGLDPEVLVGLNLGREVDLVLQAARLESESNDPHRLNLFLYGGFLGLSQAGILLLDPAPHDPKKGQNKGNHQPGDDTPEEPENPRL